MVKKIAFLVPSTTNKRNYDNIHQTELYKHLLPSVLNVSGDFQISVYVGYDDDDKLFSNIDLPKFYPPLYNNDKCNNPTDNGTNSLGYEGDDCFDGIFDIKWIPVKAMKGKPTHIWNHLGELAIKDGFEYLMVLGDDIICDKRKEWLGIFIKELKKNNNIGYSAGFSNNNDIPTQFLIHKTHIDIFGFIYPPQIVNWGCDDWMSQIYGIKWGNWLKEYQLLNVGGEPRYDIVFSENFIKAIVKRYKPTLHRYLSQK